MTVPDANLISPEPSQEGETLTGVYVKTGHVRENEDGAAVRAGEPRAALAAGDVPIPGYRQLTIPQIVSRIPTLSMGEVRKIREYERSHRRRKTLLVRLERRLRDAGGPEAE